MTSQRVAYVDSLRCIAALAVLSQHLLERADPVRFAAFLNCAPGVFGVVLFFYISGFVIPLSVQRRPALFAFLVRRVFRIYPAYLGTLVLLTIIALVKGEQPPLVQAGVLGALLNLLLLQQFFGLPAILGVTWTLSIEFIWYALFAGIFYRARNVRVSLFVLAHSLGMVLLSLGSIYLNVRVPSGRIGLVGAALVGYLAWRQQSGECRPHEYAVAVTAFVCAMTFSLYVAFGVFSHPNIRLHHSLIPWALATALFVIATHARVDRVRRVLSWRPLVFVGEISYSMYLLHGPVIMVVLPLVSTKLSLVLSPALTFVAAWLFHRCVELPGVQLGKQLERRWQERVPSLGSAST